jgi:hypothetical protein
MTCKKYVDTVANVMALTSGVPVEYRVLQAHGQKMEPKAHPLTGTMDLGRCDHNSYKAMANTNLRYCEGYAMTRGRMMPMAHSWLVDTDGWVVDPTWKDGCEYFGVVFDTLFLLKTVAKTKCLGIFGSLHMLKMRPDDCEAYINNGLDLEVT